MLKLKAVYSLHGFFKFLIMKSIYFSGKTVQELQYEIGSFLQNYDIEVIALSCYKDGGILHCAILIYK